MTNLPFKLVRISWVDSRGASSRWEYVGNAKSRVLTCQSIGYLIQDDENVKRIAPHIIKDEDGDIQVSGDMIIPSVAVLEIKPLK